MTERAAELSDCAYESGDGFKVRFTYTDGSTYDHGTWYVIDPDDARQDPGLVDTQGESLGWVIANEMAKCGARESRRIVRVELVRAA